MSEIDKLRKELHFGLDKLAEAHNTLTDGFIKHEEAISNLILDIKDLAELYKKVVAALKAASRSNGK